MSTPRDVVCEHGAIRVYCGICIARALRRVQLDHGEAVYKDGATREASENGPLPFITVLADPAERLGTANAEHPAAKPRRPRLTNKVLRGIIAATSAILAGPGDGDCEDEWEAVEVAHDWAHAMKRARRARASAGAR